MALSHVESDPCVDFMPAESVAASEEVNQAPTGQYAAVAVLDIPGTLVVPDNGVCPAELLKGVP